MNEKVKVFPISDGEAEARRAFTEHVQSVAFQISLSRRMIDLLRETRNHGFPHGDEAMFDRRLEIGLRHHLGSEKRKPFTTHDIITPIKSLERRGLLIFNNTPFEKRKKGDKWLRLSLAGEIMCELLVTAGLMPEHEEVRIAK